MTSKHGTILILCIHAAFGNAKSSYLGVHFKNKNNNFLTGNKLKKGFFPLYKIAVFFPLGLLYIGT